MQCRRPTLLKTLKEQVDPKHTALIIIDVQNDFVHPKGIYGRRTDDLWEEQPLIPRMLERLPSVLETARRTDCLRVFVRGIYDTQYISDSYAVQLERKDLYGQICLSDSFGADFYGDIRPQQSEREVVVTKHRYSAFWGTNLNTVLGSNGIKTVVMTGTATSGCVESTARDAFFNDYYTVTVDDACADHDDRAQNAMLAAMAKNFGYLVSVDEIVGIWSGEVEGQPKAAELAASAPS